jgi:serine/threonine protein kinase
MSRPNLSGHVLASKYILKKRIGNGHFGDVYIGTHAVIGREFALKVVEVDSSSINSQNLESSLQLVSMHSHIAKVESAEYWQGPDGKHFCLIEMEFVPGGSLADKIIKDISLNELIFTMKNILFALEHAHGFGIIHRDVKPANILCGGGGKLSDFGIAMVPATGASAGAYFYGGNLAPECFENPRIFSEQSDIFAAGLTLLRGLNLSKNWKIDRQAVPDWRQKMAIGKFVEKWGFHPRVPKKLRAIVRRACHPDRSHRYQTAAEFRDALEAIRIDRDWVRVSKTNWQCSHFGIPEEIAITTSSSAFIVEYRRNGRKNRSRCRKITTFVDAEAYAHASIAETSLPA